MFKINGNLSENESTLPVNHDVTPKNHALITSSHEMQVYYKHNTSNHKKTDNVLNVANAIDAIARSFKCLNSELPLQLPLCISNTKWCVITQKLI